MDGGKPRAGPLRPARLLIAFGAVETGLLVLAPAVMVLGVLAIIALRSPGRPVGIGLRFPRTLPGPEVRRDPADRRDPEDQPGRPDLTGRGRLLFRSGWAAAYWSYWPRTYRSLRRLRLPTRAPRSVWR